MHFALLPSLFFFGLSTDPCATALATRIEARIASPDRAVRADAYRDLDTLLRAGCKNRIVLKAYLEAGAETDHVLRMSVSDLSEVLPSDITPTLESALSSPKSHIRLQALRGIARLKAGSDGLIHTVLALTKDADVLVADTAAVALASIDSNRLSFHALLTDLRNGSTPQRLRAARTLDRFDRRTSVLVPELIPLLPDSDETVRYWLLNVVANSKEVVAEALRAVVGALRTDSSTFVRERAARELWEMAENTGSTSSDANDALVHALATDSDQSVRLEAAKAMRAHRPLPAKFPSALSACAKRESSELKRICAGVD